MTAGNTVSNEWVASVRRKLGTKFAIVATLCGSFFDFIVKGSGGYRNNFVTVGIVGYTVENMSKGTLTFLLGITLVLLPYLGIPSAWKQYAYVGLGVIFILLGYSLRRAQYFREIDQGNGERVSDTFVETTQNLFASSKAEYK